MSSRRKAIPTDSLLQLRQRLDHLPPKSPERAAKITAMALLYGISVTTVYRALRSFQKPHTVHRRDHGIRVGHSRPYHPQTQGKLERFHRSLKAELLQGRWFTHAAQLQEVFDAWRDTYNLERPHEALSMAVPASRYQPSSRQYNGNPAAAEYDEGVLVRKVDISGKLSLKGMGLKVGKAFIGEYVGLKESERGLLRGMVVQHESGDDRPEK